MSNMRLRQFQLLLLVRSIALVQATSISDCVIPTSWHGNEWYENTMPTGMVKITNVSMSTDFTDEFGGTCIRNLGNEYFIFANEHLKCSTCYHFTSRHHNVLQYKETKCEDFPDKKPHVFKDDREVEEFCQDGGISPGSITHYLFRHNFKPIDCPFRDALWSFNYGREGPESTVLCSNTKSTVETCMDDTQLLFNYQGCPDVPSSEMKKEEITCMANWKDQFSYLVAKVQILDRNTQEAHPVEKLYRCFAYEKFRNDTHTGYKIGISAEATCDGLSSTSTGEMSLTLYSNTSNSNDPTFCSFPAWFIKKSWQAIDHKTFFRSPSRPSEIFINSSSQKIWPPHSKMTCWMSNNTADGDQIAVVKRVVDCRSKTLCLKFSQKTDFISQLTVVKQSDVITEDEFVSQCLKGSLFGESDSQEQTLLDHSMGEETSECPLAAGLYQTAELSNDVEDGLSRLCKISDPMRDESVDLVAGCKNERQLELFNCNGDLDSMDQYVADCLGSWKDEIGSTYFLTKLVQVQDSNSKPKIYCFQLTNDSRPERLQVVGIIGNCPQINQFGISHPVRFELIKLGDCSEDFSASRNLLTQNDCGGNHWSFKLILGAVLITAIIAKLHA